MGTLVKGKKAQSTASCSKRSKSRKCILALLIAILTVSAFLPAVYAADIQFGVTTTGNTNYPTSTFGTKSSSSTTASGSAGNLIATKYTLSVPATVTKIGGYSMTAGNWKLAIYSNIKDSSNKDYPGSILASNPNTNHVTQGDNSFDIGPVFLPAGTYWIAIIADIGGTRKYVAGGGELYSYSTSFGNPLPANYPSSGATYYPNDYIAYCTYVQVEGYAKATKVTLADNNVQLNTVNFYSHKTGNYRIAIYDNGASGPNTLKWQSGDTTATIGWNTITITAGSPTSLILASGTYWIVYQWNSPNLGPSYSSSSGAGNYATMSTYGSFSNSWSGGTASSEQWSVYATYTSLTPSVLPETPVGALLAVVLCFGAFAVFVKTQKFRLKNFTSAIAGAYFF